MADLLGAMRVEIIGDNTKLDKSIDSSKKKTEDYGKFNEKLAKSLKTLFSGIAFAAVAKKILDISKRAAELSAAGEEIRSKFNAVFKDGAQDVQAWAEDYANSVGRSDTQTLSFLATLQDTFVPMGIARDKAAELSKQMVVLAGDVGSFNDVSQADVIRDFQSAAVGNTETVRKYGIVINEANTLQEALNSGLIESKDQLTEQVKIQARLNLIIQGTTDAQGDLLRTQESTTNVNAALNSQIEKTLESYGKVVNEGLLPFKKNLLEEITTINQNIKAHFLRQKVIAGDATLIENLTLKEIEQTKAEKELQQAKDNLAASEASIAANLASSNVQLQNAAIATQASLIGQQKLIESRQRAVDGIEREVGAIQKAILEERALLEEKIALTQGTDQGTESTDNNTEAVDENTEAVSENLETQQTFYNQFMGYKEDELLAIYNNRDATIESIQETSSEWDLYYANLQANAAQSTSNLLGYSSNLFSQLSALRLADAAQETELIDANLQTALDALDEEALGEEAYNDKVAELTKEANNEKAAIEYEAETASWKLKKLSAVASAAQAIVQGFAQLGPIGGAIAAVGTGILTGVQLAIIEKQKPVLQTFAAGGIVAGQNFVGDNVPAMVNSGEMILNQAQQARLFAMANGGGTTNNSSSININAMFSLGNDAQTRQAARKLFPAIQEEARRRGTSIIRG